MRTVSTREKDEAREGGEEDGAWKWEGAREEEVESEIFDNSSVNDRQ
jgi:hypothetical protein